MAARLYKFIGPNGNAAYSLLSIVESKYFTLIMLAVVMSNTVVMIFETYDDYYKEYHSFFLISERIYLCLYIIECCLKLSVRKSTSITILADPFDSTGLFVEIL